MSSTRLGLLTGPLAFLAIIGGLFSDTLPGGEVTDAQMAAYVDQHGYGAFLAMGGGVGLGGILLLVFTATLTARLEQSGAGPIAVRLVHTAGAAWAILTMFAGLAWISPFVAHASFSAGPPKADVSSLMAGLGYGALTLFAGIAAAIIAATITVTAFRTGMLPRWLAIAGIPASVLMLANVVLPMAIIVLWFTAATVCLVKRSGSAALVTHRMAPATV